MASTVALHHCSPEETVPHLLRTAMVPTDDAHAHQGHTILPLPPRGHHVRDHTVTPICRPRKAALLHNHVSKGSLPRRAAPPPPPRPTTTISASFPQRGSPRSSPPPLFCETTLSPTKPGEIDVLHARLAIGVRGEAEELILREFGEAVRLGPPNPLTIPERASHHRLPNPPLWVHGQPRIAPSLGREEPCVVRRPDPHPQHFHVAEESSVSPRRGVREDPPLEPLEPPLKQRAANGILLPCSTEAGVHCPLPNFGGYWR